MISTIPQHKIFISFHHANDQWYKEELQRLNINHDLFIDVSVDTGDIDKNLSDESIRQKIRDDYLGESTVTILLVGTETKNRNHIDWELKSSMINGKKNKKSGILVINLPSTNCKNYRASHEGEKERIYPENSSWTTIMERTELESRYPFMPDRIIDNLMESKVKISITYWDKIIDDLQGLKFLIHKTYEDKGDCEYNLSRHMKGRIQ